jgi:predicted nuclease of predicted toxin-antitoxin system
LKLLLDEMYSNVLAEALGAADIDATTVIALGLAGRSDPDVFAAAVAQDLAILTENVADFTRISADRLTSGHHHPGVVVALSSRFSRRRAGIGPLVAAIGAIADQQLEDRVVYLQHPQQP